MESAATAVLLGLGLVLVVHALNGGDSLKRWTNYALTGRGPGRTEPARPQWGLVGTNLRGAAGAIQADIGRRAREQQQRAARATEGQSTAADVRAEAGLVGAAIGQALPTFRPTVQVVMEPTPWGAAPTPKVVRD